ncbi:hypothetical protein KUA55_10340 [Enterococcus sp. ALS3]|uniref:Replication-associated protein ORF2/G2P domain-containing protein n=1 Tax=Enterococcus alishanensis TaxID=1303817 RepID=A0ABS6TDT4_9ENTE|nr:hypothetical protein [Enterococcus alishanensis]MBV7391081.1 hypothetical protein [Enterococcus alishanensis]
MFIQEKRLSIDDYQEVDIIPLSNTSRKKTKKRKEILPRPAQANNNDKRSRRYFGLLAKGNFKKGDYYGTYTFSKKYLPSNPEEAKKIFKDTFIRKVRYQFKKVGKELKYLFVMEYQEDEDGNSIERIHFHFLMCSGISRDVVEDCWSVGRGKKKESLGRRNTKLIQPDSDGIQALVNYLKKKPRWKKGVKTWSGSRNLEKPVKQVNNNKYSRRKVEKFSLSNDYGFDYFEKEYAKYHITSIEPVYNDRKGWHIYLQMIKR